MVKNLIKKVKPPPPSPPPLVEEIQAKLEAHKYGGYQLPDIWICSCCKHCPGTNGLTRHIAEEIAALQK